jgi:hypothetical protein
MPGTAKRMAKARRAKSQIEKTFDALRNGQLTVTELLQEPPACLGRVRIYNLLCKVPRLDKDGAENVIRRAKVWPLTTMSNLTRDERRALLRELPPRVKR